MLVIKSSGRKGENGIRGQEGGGGVGLATSSIVAGEDTAGPRSP